MIDNERTMIELIVDDERKRLHKEAQDAVENDDDLSEATINTLKRLAKLSQDYVENAEAEEDTDSEADTEKGLEKKDKCLDTEPEDEPPQKQHKCLDTEPEEKDKCLDTEPTHLANTDPSRHGAYPTSKRRPSWHVTLSVSVVLG